MAESKISPLCPHCGSLLSRKWPSDEGIWWCSGCEFLFSQAGLRIASLETELVGVRADLDLYKEGSSLDSKLIINLSKRLEDFETAAVKAIKGDCSGLRKCIAREKKIRKKYGIV
jgi:hypothetical protein